MYVYIYTHINVCVLSHFSRVWLSVTPWTAALQAALSMGFPRQEHCSGLSCPPPGHLLDPGIEHMSLRSPALAGRFFTTSAAWEAPGPGLFRFPTGVPIHSPLKNGRVSIYPFPGVDFCPLILYKVQTSQSPGGGAKRRTLLYANKWAEVLGLESQVFHWESLHIWSRFQGQFQERVFPLVLQRN